MALYVTRPRRDEERIGRGLPSDLQLSYQITERLLATGNNPLIKKIKVPMKEQIIINAEKSNSSASQVFF